MYKTGHYYGERYLIKRVYEQRGTEGCMQAARDGYTHHTYTKDREFLIYKKAVPSKVPGEYEFEFVAIPYFICLGWKPNPPHTLRIKDDNSPNEYFDICKIYDSDKDALADGWKSLYASSGYMIFCCRDVDIDHDNMYYSAVKLENCELLNARISLR